MTREELIHHIRYALDIGADIILTNEEGEEIIKTLEQEPCEDCISRETARRIVDSGRTRQQMIDMILATPPVTPQPKTGHWISLDTGKPSRIKDGIPTESVKCSECDEWLTASDEYACKGNYCPNCGAKMVEPQESEE